MSTKQEAQEQAARDKNDLAALCAALGSRVLEILGRPADFQRVQVRRLWENNFRVNVLAGNDAATACVAHSFFVATDAAGNILVSVPPLPKGGQRTDHAPPFPPPAAIGTSKPEDEPPCATVL